jgi:type II secretory pathway component PulF
VNLTYDAIDTQGRQIRDTLQAGSVRDGVDELRKRGLFVTKIAPGKEDAAPATDGKAVNPEVSHAKMSISQLMIFTRQMSMLLKSGSAIVPALSAIAMQLKNPAHQRMLQLVKEDLEYGESLADAFGKYPKSFDATYRAVVAAGESSATLPEMFSRLAVLIGRRRSMGNKIIGALVYPCLLIGLSVVIQAVMMFFVIPRFSGMFETLGVELPASTKFMMATANGLRQYWYLYALLLCGAVAGLVALIKTDGGRQLVCNWQTRIPIVGRLMSRLIQAQTFRILGMLLEARIGLMSAMDLARKVTRNDQFQTLYDDLEESVTRGDSVSSALERGSLIAPSIVQAVRTGEQSGKLGESISYVADVLDEENLELLSATTKLIEPAVLIVMGLVAGGVAISLFLPLFDMTSAV